jgi:hypothetical protein
VDALSSLRGVMSWMSGTSLSASAATAGLAAIAACVDTYCEFALADCFWFGFVMSWALMRSSAVAWKTGACRDEMK